MTANSRGPREDAEGSGDGERDVTETVAEQELPEGLTVQETLDWVSGDKAKAKVAVDAENEREKPRHGVLGGLQSLIDDETGAGIASGEA